MTELGIDTAGAGCSVGLRFGASDDDLRVFARLEPGGRGQSERVMELLQELIDEAGVDYRSLKRIICTIGPGSFTGVRVGLALAKGLAFASGASLFGVSRLVLMGHKYAQSSEIVSSDMVFVGFLNAGRGAFYMQAFAQKSVYETTKKDGMANANLHMLCPPELVERENVLDFMARFNTERLVGLDKDLIESDKLLNHLSVDEIEILAQDLFVLDEHFLEQGQNISALYLRAVDAKPQQGKMLERRCS